MLQNVKNYIMLLLLALSLCSCESDTSGAPIDNAVPIGILFLAHVGVIAIIVALVGFLVFFGPWNSGERDD